ncbi:MAG: beta-phosphoglucomutase family hydrolase, partial [Acidimicrobiia bacterium]|nr:beta-phosphoglucomutase family hydrolase [Acidimicrobiia bacterium]
VTDTASVHAAAWKQLFDEVLGELSPGTTRAFAHEDYLLYVDGRARADGIEAFLRSRQISLPAGTDGDPPSALTVRELAARKDRYFQERLRRDGVTAFPDAVAFLDELRAAGLPVAVASASRNCSEVLQSAHLEAKFDAQVDGLVAAALGLPSKPNPALFLEACRRVHCPPAETMLIEDALAGVEAGRSGDFGLVVGVDRTGRREGLLNAGADVVVERLTDLRVGPPAP